GEHVVHYAGKAARLLPDEGQAAADHFPGRRQLVDGDAFSQILSNLLSNVEKYAGPGASCHITGQAAGGTLTLTVADDGPGVPPAAREKIFRPFGRAREGTREGVSGTGLGLSISRDLAARMGGTLELLPSAKGAAFRLVIPTAGKETAAC
ncbi:MAG: ATP-binding protein, partial [Verrucomicrobiaceae bacterium]